MRSQSSSLGLVGLVTVALIIVSCRLGRGTHINVLPIGRCGLQAADQYRSYRVVSLLEQTNHTLGVCYANTASQICSPCACSQQAAGSTVMSTRPPPSPVPYALHQGSVQAGRAHFRCNYCLLFLVLKS